jgi:hypothetical protein
LKTPVAFLIFNRPETTAQIFAEIRRARPSKLLLVADGPRAGRVEEAEACRATRAVVERVDWDCEVLTNYAEENLGCRARVASGLTWVFEQAEEAIILEDDCLPHESFFPFCEELLERYRDDERVMMISGDNFQFGRRRSPYSYYFSRMVHIWGWASWRRAWQHYDLEMKLWPTLRDSAWLKEMFDDEEAAHYWRTIFDKTYAGHDTWDYQWAFACWAQSGLSVLPDCNLISNIGFGDDATHTKAAGNPSAALPLEAIGFPLQHPPYMFRNGEADDFTLRQVVLPQKPTLYRRLRSKIHAVVPSPAR